MRCVCLSCLTGPPRPVGPRRPGATDTGKNGQYEDQNAHGEFFMVLEVKSNHCASV